ncbi:hypothetical protein EHQ27_02250 [Leptospira wolffii]|uniref:hypothetical protein n=1 Tax=Leptospira wolffii TaxID=409998 RepID=UPI000349421F|nr:hypothetical protein [Leptospira wolffii]TGK64702.1 hypothetical protein EHQ32_00320 [Leptospira wolffii]TGK76899.1 hypothetical protein EHQ35_00895 [Leptospira wolffii]TGK77249.1 hypothetical protein EHQ27_02250 [Leptospira wolffii]TGL26644.1 hypothetical protein EHQ57_18155 [Leptospira wolffii]
MQKTRLPLKAILLLFLSLWESNCMFSLVERKDTTRISIDRNIKIQLAPGTIYVGGINTGTDSFGNLLIFSKLMAHYKAVEVAKQNAEYKLLNFNDNPTAGRKGHVLKIAMSVYARPAVEYFECMSGAIGDPMHPVYLPRTTMSLCLNQVFVALNVFTLGIVPAWTEGMIEVEYKVSFGEKEYVYHYYPKYKAYKGIIPFLTSSSDRTFMADSLYTGVYSFLVAETVDSLLMDIQGSVLLGK